MVDAVACQGRVEKTVTIVPYFTPKLLLKLAGALLPKKHVTGLNRSRWSFKEPTRGAGAGRLTTILRA